jgi:DNA topoisomerase-1
MPAGEKIETVTLKDALKMFALPRIVGKTETGEEIKANTGRFGPYIQVGSTFVSIKPMSPFDISEAEARMLYDEKLKNDAKRVLKEFDGGKIKISRGGFGKKYISDGEIKAVLPKDIDIEKITDEKAREIMELAKSKKGGTKKTTAKRKTTRKKTTKK